MLKKIFKVFFNLLIKFKLYHIISIIFLLVIKKHNLRFDKIFFKTKKRILAIGSSKFREDLEYIKNFERYHLFSLDHKWQSLITRYFCSTNEVLNYLNNKKNIVFKKESERIQRFNNQLLKVLNKILKIDLILIVNYRYIDDFFWINSFKKINVKILMLYREGLLANERIYDEVLLRHKNFAGIKIDYIISPNEIVRKSFLKANFIESNKIFTAGTLRMDNFLKKIYKLKKQKLEKINKTKIFVFFDIPDNLSLFGKKFYDITPKKYSYALKFWDKTIFFLNEIHNTIIEIARENPDLKIIVKPKIYEFHKNKTGLIHNLVKMKKKYRISNLYILPFANTHQLILEAHFGMQFLFLPNRKILPIARPNLFYVLTD